MYAWVNWVIIGLGNSCVPVQCQAIIYIYADLLSTGPFEQPSVKFKSKYQNIPWTKRIWKCRLKNITYPIDIFYHCNN